MTNRVTAKIVDDLTDTTAKLLVRMIEFPSPPTHPLELWQRHLPGAVWNALELLSEHNRGRRTLVYRYADSWVPVRVSAMEQYAVRLTHTDGFPAFVADEPVPANKLATSTEEYEALVSWLRTCEIIRTQVDSAYAVIQQTLGMVTTVGQIKRMVPEMVQYLPATARTAISNQRRRSNLPAQWMCVDRSQLRAATDILAKCYLLEPKGRPMSLKDTLESVSWAYHVYPDNKYFCADQGWTAQPRHSFG